MPITHKDGLCIFLPSLCIDKEKTSRQHGASGAFPHWTWRRRYGGAHSGIRNLHGGRKGNERGQMDLSVTNVAAHWNKQEYETVRKGHVHIIQKHTINITTPASPPLSPLPFPALGPFPPLPFPFLLPSLDLSSSLLIWRFRLFDVFVYMTSHLTSFNVLTSLGSLNYISLQCRASFALVNGSTGVETLCNPVFSLKIQQFPISSETINPRDFLFLNFARQ